MGYLFFVLFAMVNLLLKFKVSLELSNNVLIFAVSKETK
ncbi:hypothetical protein B124-14_010 [Bacteroides phage B124-14]|nr:hypothetical protein B124-14_010 [Bacteroides phage B124-14]CCE45939.1 hypothetical protein B124-14_010 [Bacteroides phage B124-14]